jgi:flagellar biogenesis protein FliO
MISGDIDVRTGFVVVGQNRRSLGRALAGLWEKMWAQSKAILRIRSSSVRRLHLCESLSLGDRRFVAVVEFEGARFLLGGTPASLALLARLEDAAPPTQDRAAHLQEKHELGPAPIQLKESR